MSRLILVSTLGLGAFAAIASAALVLAGAGEQTESFLYVVAFAIVLPGSILAGLWLTRALGTAMTPVAALWAAGLLAVLLIARLAYATDGDSSAGSPAFLAGLVAWGGSALLVAHRAVAASPPVWFKRFAALAPAQQMAAPALLLGALLLGFAPPGQLDIPSIAAAGVLAAAGMYAYLLLLRRRLDRRAGIAVDAIVVLGVLAIGNDLAIYDEVDRFFNRTSNVHQNFYLGTANDVLHGRAMLVDSFSQYGVGIFYLLAGWFFVTDVGYGAMTLISGLLTAVQILAGYAILRLAGASRPLSAATTGVVTVAIFFADDLPPPTSHPSLGGLRYLLPYLVIAAFLWSERREGRGRSALPLALVGLAALWSIETFAYCVAAFAGMTAFGAFAAAGEWRAALAPIARRLAAAAGVAVAVNALFAFATRALAGGWPEWGGYLSFLGAYDVEGISAIPVEPWSPGLAVGAMYFVSAAALVLILVNRRDRLVEDRLSLIAIAGLVPAGLVTFSYFIGNSQPDGLLVIGVPAFLSVALWLTILERNREGVPQRAMVAALTPVFLAAGVLALFARPALEDRLPDTPAAKVLKPREGADRLRRMLRSEPLSDRVTGANRLLERHFPGDGPALVVAQQENTVHALVDARRVNRLPVSHFLQDGLVMDRAWRRVKGEIDRLRPGDLMLTEPEALELSPRFPAPLLQRTAAEIQRRFELRTIDRDGTFIVVRLVARRT